MSRSNIIVIIAALATITSNLPAQPLAPYLWLRADSGCVSNNGRVSTWDDVSGNSFVFTQQDTALQPTLLSNLKDGPDCVHFDGTDFMNGMPVFPTRADYTLFLVIRVTDLTATNNVLSGTTYAHYFGSNPYLKVLHGDFSTLAVSGVPVIQSALALLTVRYNESTRRASIWLNGALADSSFVGSNHDSTMYLGAYRAANLLKGDIAEIMLYNSLMSAAERETTEQYLAAKFALHLPAPLSTPFTAIPARLQFVARDNQDSATLPIEGVISTQGFDSVYVVVTKNKQFWQRKSVPLIYANGSAPFKLYPKIHAELSEYSIDVRIKNSVRDSSIAVRDSIVCGDVFFINGQSNSIFGNGNQTTTEYCRTFGKNFSHAFADTSWALANAYGNGGGTQVGAWGFRMQQLLSNHAQIPICIINGGVGGTTIEQHRRDSVEPENSNTIYGSMLYRAQKSGLANKARAMFWYQGESNNGDEYYAKFLSLYTNWKRDYPSLERIYVVQIRPGCGGTEHGRLREVLRTLPDSLSDVTVYSPMGVGAHDGCHFAPAGYDTIGTQMFRMVAIDFYNSLDTAGVGSPTISRIYYQDSTYTVVNVELTNAGSGLQSTPIVTVGSADVTLADAFFINDTVQAVRQATISGNTIRLVLTSAFPDATLTYIPDKVYAGTNVVYEGPWIQNERGYGACSFFHQTIQQPSTSNVSDGTNNDDVLRCFPNPATEFTTIEFSSAIEQQCMVTIHDGIGKVIEQHIVKATSGVNEFRLPLAQLHPGWYVCTVNDSIGIRQTSFIVH